MAEGTQAEDHAERAAVSYAVAQEFHLPEADVAGNVYLAADWPGQIQEGAVLLVQTGDSVPVGDAESAARSWMNVNDRLEEQGVGLYCEIKSASVTAFYRFS